MNSRHLVFGIVMSLVVYKLPAQTIPKIDIQLNQLGFYPNGSKLAVLTRSVPGNIFYLVTKDLKDTVFQAALGPTITSKNSSLTTRVADFSSFKKQGNYVVVVPGARNSFPFRIEGSVHRPVSIAVLKGYYYQRVSMPLEGKYAGKWNRPAGHPDTAVLIHPSAASEKRPAGTVIASPGGWYDAGDYNKYIVNSGITMGTILSAYEDFPAYFKQLKTNIPESDNNIPDILDEVLYNLRWMLTMQDPVDGGVYNKCTNASFDGMVMPGVTKAPRYVVQKGTSATLDFAAVTAQSARILKRFEKELPGLSDSCLRAAKLAWKWALANPEMVYNQTANNKKFLPVISTGGYGDRHFEDEFFWAACELFCTTLSDEYLPVIEKNNSATFSIPSWANVQMPGFYSLFRNTGSISSKLNTFITEAKQKLLSFADEVQMGADSSAFKTVMGKSRRDFNWGSNSNAANQSIVLINAYLLTRNKKYIDNALTNLDYILGRNATGYSFVTGVGTRYPMHPHHRQSVADGIDEPVPGLLAGGPNPGKQDGCDYEYNEPETAYADVDCSFASNEIAINWNAPLVYLANAVEALQYEVGYTKK